MTTEPSISVVIATRNRPQSLARLLDCVKRQELQDIECIVADDGSSRETIAAYDGIWRGLDDRFRLVQRAPGEAGGPSAARNRGIRAARGEFIAFCDDDDLWIRSDHLAVAAAAMRQYGADLYFANLQTSRNGQVIGPDFYGSVRPHLTRQPLGGELYEVPRRSRAASMQHMFLHCDSIVVSRRLLFDCGLYWEKLTMAEDRDLGLRLLDRAEKVVYRATVVADYDRSAQIGICRSYTEDEIRQFIILAMLHAETAMRDAALRRVARGYRAWMLVELAESAREAGRGDRAKELAFQSLLLRPTAAALGLLFAAGAGPHEKDVVPQLEDGTKAN